MREIKFRAWDTKRCLWVSPSQGLAFYGNTGTPTAGVLLGFPRSRMRNIEILQFTGLKDKNSRDIYEGDILKSGKHVTPVIFSDGKFICEGVPQSSLKALAKHGVVLGSIYENPELVEESE